MAWIESHETLSKHPKTICAVGQLRVDRHKFLGHLHTLWWWALQHIPPDGDLGKLSDEGIAMAAEWDGDATDFVAALTTCGEPLFDSGFIEIRDDKRYLHDWYEHAGRYAEKRDANAKRMRNARAANVQSTCGARAALTFTNEDQDNGSRETDAYASAPDGALPESSRVKVPQPMFAVLNHLLTETGRPRHLITNDERKAAYDLNRVHTAGAVCSEINRAVKRFRSKGRDLSELTLDYIWDSMKARPPTIASKKAEWERARQKPRNPFLDDVEGDTS